MNINLTIGELVFEGLPPERRLELTAAVERALGRILQSRGLPSGAIADRYLAEHVAMVRYSVSSEPTATELAESIYSALSAPNFR